jgi:hypothetical protein
MKDMVRAGLMRRPRRLPVRLMRVGEFKTGKGAGEDRRFSWLRLAGEGGWDLRSSSVPSL